MDKIYSRKRIKIFYSDKKTIKKKITFSLVIMIAVITIMYSVKSIDPIFENLCKEKAIQISTDILNTESTKVVHRYEYKDLITIIKELKFIGKNMNQIAMKANETNMVDALQYKKNFDMLHKTVSKLITGDYKWQ